MPEKLNELLVPGTRIEVTPTMPASSTPTTKVLLLLEVSNVHESYMQDGYLFDLAVLNPDGRVGHIMVHEKEIAGHPWFNSRLLKFVK